MKGQSYKVTHIYCPGYGEDNYSYLIEPADPNNCILVDPCEYNPIKQYLETRNNIKVANIFCTHKHYDHIGGAKQLIQYFNKKYGLKPNVFIGKRDSQSFATHEVSKVQKIKISNLEVTMRQSPCHTKGHVLYYLEAGGKRSVFTGDTLFIGGCGRFFDGGTGEQMSKNYDWLRHLPDDTLVYDGHEYTLQSMKWGYGMDLKDGHLYEAYMKECRQKIAQGLPTSPGTIGQEKKTNIFMKSFTCPHVQKICGTNNVGQCFQKLREWKNRGKRLR